MNRSMVRPLLASRMVAMMCLALIASATQAQRTSGAPAEGLLSGFVDDLGHEVDRRTLRRPLRLVFFGYTSCPDVCPLTLAAVHRALQTLGPIADRIDPVFVTVDPDRDTVTRLHSYVSAFDSRIRAYRADPRRLDTLTRALNVRYRREETPGSRDYSVSHTATMFVIDRDGRVLAQVYHYTDPTALSDEIVTAVRPIIGGSSRSEHSQ